MKSKKIVSLGIMAALFTGMVLTGCGQTQQMGQQNWRHRKHQKKLEQPVKW